MARISQYDQDGTLNKLDKVLGTDSATGATKNYSIDSMMGLVNSEDLVNVFDGVSYSFKSYEAGSTTPRGIINLNAGAASNAAFSAINQIYISILDKHGNSIADYLDDTLNSFIRIVQKTNINTYGVLEVTAVADHDGGAYKLLTVTPRVNNGNIVVNEEYFVSNYSAVFDQDFSDDSVTEFSDVSNAGSGEIITTAERQSLNNFTANGLLHADVVNNVTSTATDVPLSAAQGKVLKDLIDTINTLLTSDNINLDSLQEVVDFIEANKDTLDNLGINNIAGLQAALDAKQDAEVGKGLSTEDFTTALLTKLNGIAAQAEVNVNANWNETNSNSDAFIQNKPTDLTTLATHNVTELSDVTSAGSGSIISSAERTKLQGIEQSADVTDTTNVTAAGALMDSEVTNLAQVKAFNTADYATAAQGVKADSAQQPPAEGAFVDGDKTKLDGIESLADVTDTANVTAAGALMDSELTNEAAVKAINQGLATTDDVDFNSIQIDDTIELITAQSSTPTFDNGIYYTTEDGHDTLHFRYHGHDLSIDYLTENIPTGILNGGVLSTNTSTTFDVAAGDGVINILNKGVADPHPEIKKIAWSATTVTHTLGNAGDANQLNTWVYVDSSGNIQQTLTTPSPALWRSNIVLGSVIHSSNAIRFVKTFPRPSYSNGNTFAEFVEIFGPLKKSGHLLTVNSTNTLALDRAAGISFGVGRNYQVDAEEPNLVSDSASTPSFHRYSSTASGFTKDDGTAGAGYTSIDPTKYDNSGTLTTTSSGQYTVQRLFHFPNNTNVIVVYYGKAEYASIDEAEKNYLLEDFQEADNTSSQAIYLGALVVKGNATDLGNSAQAKILTGGIFRSLSATNLGGVAADAAINELSDVNITGVANNEVLKYNGSTGNWENQTDDTIGGSGSGVANKIAIWSGASALTQDTNLHWDAVNDRLGIGTSSPNAALEIHGNLNIGDGTSVTSIGLQRNSANYITATDAAGYLVFRTGGANERLRIDSSGNVGIGTAAPKGDLHVAGAAGSAGRIYLSDSDNGVESTDSLLIMKSGSNAFVYNRDGGQMSFGTNNVTNTLNIANTGNVGIGTTSPGTKLDVVASGLASLFRVSNTTADATTKYGAITGRHYTNSEENVTGMLITSNSSATGGTVSIGGGITAANAVNNIILYTAANNTTLLGTERMRIDSAGLVGIGTSSPSTKLQVKTDTNGDGIQIQHNSTTAGTYGQLGFLSSTNDSGAANVWIRGYRGSSFTDNFMTFGTGGNTGSEAMRIDSSGNVGIGTTSPANGKLQIDSNGTSNQISIETGTSGDGRLHIGHFSNGAFIGTYGDDGGVGDVIRFGTHSGDERMRIDSSGNVGIGTTSPSYRLDISGSLRVTSESTFTSNLLFPDNARIKFGNNQDFNLYRTSTDSYISSSDGDILIDNHADDKDIILRGDDGSGGLTEYLRLDGSTTNAYFLNPGNVGIGTNNPTSVLHISSITPEIYLEDLNNTADAKLLANNGNLGLFSDVNNEYASSIMYFNVDGSEKMRIDSAGNVGIGTSSPDAAGYVNLETAKNIRINVANANANPVLYFSHDNFSSSTSNFIELNRTDESMRFDVNSGERLRIASTGQIKFNAYTSASAFTGTAAANLAVDSSGNIITEAAAAVITWQSTAKTSSFTASSNEGYFVDTSSSAITITFPSAPSVGDLLAFTDFSSSFATNNVTLTSSKKILGADDDFLLDSNNQAIELVFSGDTKGWLISSAANEGTEAVSAAPVEIDFLVVAGGGGGGRARVSVSSIQNSAGGGGGAGEFLYLTGQEIELNKNHTVTVGAGGATETNGSDSRFLTTGNQSTPFDYTCSGGGYGGRRALTGNDGGSGGGGAGTYYSSYTAGGDSVKNEEAFGSLGNDGGNGNHVNGSRGAGGGGGAGAAGGNNSGASGGSGGNGYASDITGTSVTYAGGGGGGADTLSGGSPGTGGTGGGGSHSSGTTNTGGGGGGGSWNSTSGRSGGSGIVIIKYPDTLTLTVGSNLTSSTDTSVSGFKITTFTAGADTISWS